MEELKSIQLESQIFTKEERKEEPTWQLLPPPQFVYEDIGRYPSDVQIQGSPP